MRLTHAARWVLVVALAALGAPVSSSSAQPASPPTRGIGAIALLANLNDHSADGALREALRDSEPSVRTVAARVIAVVPHADLIKDLVGALAREKDAATAAELGRSLLYLLGAGGLDIVNAQAARFGPELAPVIAEWTARMQPERFAASLPQLATLSGEGAGRLAAIVSMAGKTHPMQRDAIFRSWMAVAPDGAWSELLGRAFGLPAGLAGSAPLLKDALASTRPSIRQETLWFVLDALASKRSMPDAIVEAALPADVAGQTEWERLGRELAGRRGKKIPVQDRSDLLKIEAVRHREDARAVRSLPELTAAERAALTALYGPPKADIDWTGVATTRTIPAIVQGVIADTLASAGCDISKAPKMAQASETFHPDGRPLRLEIYSASMVPPCMTAFTALMRLAVADPDHPVVATPQRLMLPLTPAFVDCSNVPLDVSRSDSLRQPGTITPPRKVHDAKPVYPEDAQNQRIQGVVILSATLTNTGCVSSARVVRSIPYLDAPALLAVSQWVFEPARVDGTPRAVLMTVNVNFVLQ
jgi:TonB family protein